jgi:hypothetical protein
VSASADREANVGFVSSLLETEIAQRNERKEAQETTARWIVASAGLFLTLLVGLAKDAGIFGAKTTTLAEASFIAAIALGALSAGAAIGVIWPRDYERLGAAGLDKLNDSAFLDSPQHEVTGAAVATRVAVAKRMDELHRPQANWLQLSLALLVGAFLALIVLGAGLLAGHHGSTEGASTMSMRDLEEFQHPRAPWPTLLLTRPHQPLPPWSQRHPCSRPLTKRPTPSPAPRSRHTHPCR